MDVIVVEIDEEKIRRQFANPAVRGMKDVLLVDDTQVIGKMRIHSARGYPGSILGVYESVLVEPADDATKAFFADDIGWIDGHLYGLCYSGLDGTPYERDPEDSGRHKGTRIVDAFYFDWGLAPEEFANVEGFGDYHKRKNRLRIHEPQKSRRPRNSNKIRKVR